MRLFLSYNSKNRSFIQHIASGLIREGFEVFFDQESIAPGDVWIRKIQDGISSSDASLVFIGEEGLGGWQSKEVLAIVNGAIKSEAYLIIPVILPVNGHFVNYQLPWFLADYQWVEFKDMDDPFAYARLLASLRPSQVGKIGPQHAVNPYKGLSSFEVEDSRFFFGRTYDVNLVFHNKLRFHLGILRHNFLAVVGDSGSGKSSLIKAGILAELKNGRFAQSSAWQQIILRPGSSPLGSLSSQLKQQGLINESRQFEEKSMEHDDELLRVIRDQGKTWVIYVDQFEEVITQCKNEGERVAFLSSLARARESEKAIILLSLRSDFYAAFAPYTLFKNTLEDSNYTLSPIGQMRFAGGDESDILREIITTPALVAGVKIESNLVDTLINDLSPVKGILPILQLTLDLLWKQKGGRSNISLDDYAAVSDNRNLQGIIEKHATGVYNDITNNRKDKEKIALFRRIFIPYLVEVGEGGSDVRRTALKSEILGVRDHPTGEIEAMITSLTDENSRLLSVLGGESEKVQVVHEVLIREWTLLKEWVNERRSALIFFERLDKDAKAWKSGKARFYKGKVLLEANSHVRESPDLTNATILEFVNSANRALRRKRIIRVSAAIALLVLTPLMFKWYENIQFRTKIHTLASLESQIIAYGNEPDSVLALEINNSVNGDVLTAGDMARFTRLETLKITNYFIRDLSFLAKCRSLKELTLTVDTNLTSLKGIETLVALQTLTISYNGHGSIRDTANPSKQPRLSLRGIEKLPQLNDVWLNSFTAANVFQDLDPVLSVRSLSLTNCNHISGLTGIEKFESLDSLKLGSNRRLKSLSGIAGLANLQDLEIDNIDSLVDLGNLDNLAALRTLRVQENHKLQTLRIGHLPALRNLLLIRNFQLRSLDGIDRLKALRTLEINFSKLRDLRELSHLDSLSQLDLEINDSLKDLSGLAGLPSLQTLNISDSRLLADLTGLERIPVYSVRQSVDLTNLKNLTGSRDLPSLHYLLVNFDRGLDLRGLAGIKSLISVDLQWDSITNITEIGGLNKLKTLSLAGNERLADLNALRNLPALCDLAIMNVPRLFSLGQLGRMPSLKSLSMNNAGLTSLTRYRFDYNNMTVDEYNIASLKGIVI